MSEFTDTYLWATTLDEGVENKTPGERDARERLRAAYLSFRDRARILAAEIPRDLPDYTVHDVTHLDALWEMAGLIAGPDYPFTPSEAFVLGGAFLVHDLGMALAAYPDGMEALRNERGWKDAVAVFWQPRLGRHPTLEELENPLGDIESLAAAEMLRLLHARRAESLALTSWQTNEGATYRLIESPELSGQFGPLMGRIAHSHWWSVDKLREEFANLRLGAPTGYPPDWTVDSLKLACLLRLADVSHVDARRAPGFLRALRQPQGIAQEHWSFQERLHQPYRSEDRLTYTSGQPFTVQQASAWWLCFDSLQMIDRELRQVDALLADLNQSDRPRLAARSVTGVEEPGRLVRHVRTEGWTPVDARLKVGNVAQLVKRLGGEELYGRDPTVPLRELIQNGSDAVRARRVLEDRSETWGTLTVRLGQDPEGYWIEVEDTGVGMSADVLTGTLLDFGASYWGSSLMRQEMPGVLARGFESTGKYGIGFFSVFMWGQRVRIVTRRPEAAQLDTLILEFETGLESRPILRKANEEEVIREGGTRVRVWLKDSPYEDRGLLHRGTDEGIWALSTLCAWLAPALDVDLSVEQETQGFERVITANDWLTLEPQALFYRVLGPEAARPEEADYADTYPPNMEQNLRLIEDVDATTTGRAFIYRHRDHQPGTIREKRSRYRRIRNLGVVTVGGLRATAANSVGGVLVGKPVRAARDKAVPVVSSNSLAKWASEQARLLQESNPSDTESQAEVAQVIRALGGNPGCLPVAQTAIGWMTAPEIASQEHPNEVLLVQDAAVSNAQRNLMAENFTLNPGVFTVAMGIPGILQSGMDHFVSWPPMRKMISGEPWFAGSTLSGLVIEALARAWDCAVEEVIEVSDFSTDDIEIRKDIALADDEAVTERVDVIRNPARHS